MTIRITGITARDTHYTVAPDGRTRLHVEVHTGETHHAIARAVMLVGTGAAAQIAAANAAHHLRRGRRVTLYGGGLEVLNGRLIVTSDVRIQPDDAVANRHITEAHPA